MKRNEKKWIKDPTCVTGTGNGVGGGIESETTGGISKGTSDG